MERTERIYRVIRMSNGKTTHLSSVGSSTTYCGRWSGNTRQYATDEKTIRCKACCRHMMDYRTVLSEALAQGFEMETEQ